MLTTAVGVATTRKEWSQVAEALLQLNWAERMQARWDSAIAYAEKAREAARQARDGSYEARAFLGQAKAELSRKELGPAAKHAEAVAQLAAAGTDVKLRFDTLDNWSEVQVALGQSNAAAETLDRALRLKGLKDDSLFYGYLDRADIYLHIAERCDYQPICEACLEAVEASRADNLRAMKLAHRLGWGALEKTGAGFQRPARPTEIHDPIAATHGHECRQRTGFSPHASIGRFGDRPLRVRGDRRDTAGHRADRKAVGGFDVVHLSVHGKFNHEEPLLSYIGLSPDKADKDDGHLTAAEMFGLPLVRAALVVLSACESGKLEVTRGNEVLGMVRGLLYAGAGALVLSRWKVDATATALWMETFHREARTRGLTEAARLALRAVRSDPHYAHPYLPVNYGVLVLDTSLAQVTTLGAESLPAGDEAWLVWEGKDTITFLVRRHGNARSLVALPRAESKRIEIVGYGKLPELLRARTSTQAVPNAKP